MYSFGLLGYIYCALVVMASPTLAVDDTTSQEMTLDLGSDFTMYVMTVMDDVSRCYLVTPAGEDLDFIPEDPSVDHSKYRLREPNALVGCSVEINRVDENDDGVWHLHSVSKDGVERSQTYNIIVQSTGAGSNGANAEEEESQVIPEPIHDVTWKLGQAVDELIGPNYSVYCKVSDPTGLVTNEGSVCRVVLDKVENWHDGRWTLMVWADGKIVPELRHLDVAVTNTEEKPIVSTYVYEQPNIVLLSCSVPVDAEVQECQFNDPSGQMLRVKGDVSDGRYSSYKNSEDPTGCRCYLKITRPTLADLGQWRCTIVTRQDSYHGFLAVTSADFDDSEYSATVTEPYLRVARPVVFAAAGQRPVLACSIAAPIRYCYFTATRNGTVYSVWPGSENYVGAGFDAGECGARLPEVRSEDAGLWRCHVATGDHFRPELTAGVSLRVATEARMSTRVVWSGYWTPLQVEGRVEGKPLLDYCRFVRSDGLGFTADNAPAGYRVSRALQSDRRCVLSVARPASVDLHPWTIAARARGEAVEVTATTRSLIFATPLYSSYITFWIVVMIIGISLFLIGLLMGPRKHREWTYRQADTVRQSIRRSFTKTVPTEQDSTPVAA